MNPPAVAAPQLVAPGDRGWLVHDAAASRAIEADALARHAPQLLMQRAGLGLARLALALAPHAQRVWVAAGPGNNGGDGLVAATHLHRAGRSVRVSLCADAARLPADAAQALADAQAAGVAITPALPEDSATQAFELTIDALLGLGAGRPPQGAIAAAIARLNAGAAPCLAADLPSGLHPDTGRLLGAHAVRATATLALLTLKPGLFTGAGRDHAGSIWLDPLGVDVTAAPAGIRLAGVQDLRAALPPRRHASHKGSYGDIAVVGGAAGMTGAAWLAARAALAAGAGRVFVDLLGEPGCSGDPARPELMLRPGWWRSPVEVLARSVVVAGCGGGTAIDAALPTLLARCPRLVLDADALNRLAAEPALYSRLQPRRARGWHTVLTPHPLEAARLLQTDATAVQADRIAAARRLAHETGCVVLLKGTGTVIADADGGCVLNPTGSARLATGGSGDVLAGWLGGLWAQQPRDRDDDRGAAAAVGAAGADRRSGALRAEPVHADGGQAALRATVAAAWTHGRAGEDDHDDPAPIVLRAADLIERLQAVTSRTLRTTG